FSKVCDEVRSSVSTKLQPFLHTLPVTANIDKVAGIDYSLVGPPVATDSSVDLALKGEFFSITHRSPAPFSPPTMALPEAHDRMLYFGVSTYFFNTAGLVYYTAGALTYAITDDMIPKDIQLRLNTTSMLKLLYPNMAMKLRVSPSSAPALAITPEMLSLQPLVDVQAFAILPNSTLAPLFIIGVVRHRPWVFPLGLCWMALTPLEGAGSSLGNPPKPPCHVRLRGFGDMERLPRPWPGLSRAPSGQGGPGPSHLRAGDLQVRLLRWTPCGAALDGR
uniref:Bactericidal permeability-increasing protein n=1 Tax=Varanus komodoensis TaxID=61221 RepID=A0A8D2L2F2_VARKO